MDQEISYDTEYYFDLLMSSVMEFEGINLNECYYDRFIENEKEPPLDEMEHSHLIPNSGVGKTCENQIETTVSHKSESVVFGPGNNCKQELNIENNDLSVTEHPEEFCYTDILRHPTGQSQALSVQNTGRTSLCLADLGLIPKEEYNRLCAVREAHPSQYTKCLDSSYHNKEKNIEHQPALEPSNVSTQKEISEQSKNHAVYSPNITPKNNDKSRRELVVLDISQVSKGNKKPRKSLRKCGPTSLEQLAKNKIVSRSHTAFKEETKNISSSSKEAILFRKQKYMSSQNHRVSTAISHSQVKDDEMKITLGELEEMYKTEEPAADFEGNNNASYVCDICLSKFQMHSTYMSHLARNITSMAMECWVCKKTLIFTNYCRLKGHIKTHEFSGKIFRKSILVNIKKLTRSNKYPTVEENISKRKVCPECSLKCDSLKTHLSSIRKPLDWELECAVCLYIAPSMCSLKMHLRIHAKKAPYSCPDCGQVFAAYNSLNTHLKCICFHFKKSIKCFCSYCGDLFNNQKLFKSHIVNMHNTLLYKCAECTFSCNTLKEVNQHSNTRHPFRSSKTNPLFHLCQYCPGLLISRGKYSRHVMTHLKDISSVIYVYSCTKCQLVTSNYNQFLEHSISPLCKDNNLVHQPTPKSERNSSGDINTHVDQGKRDLTNEEKKHIESTKLSPHCDLLYKIPRCDFRRSKGRVTLKNKVRAIYTKSGFKKGENLEKYKMVKYSNSGLLKCKECNFETAVLSNFRDHIVIHRKDPNLFQCLECGECFVVQPSLEKHLIGIHNISNTEEYINSHNVCNRLNEKKKPLLAHQCSVCQEVFSSQSELHKHFRSHGMAFLNQMKLV